MIRDILEKASGIHAIVLGDLMLDEYIFGDATRISPEAPVMVIRQTESRAVPGGAANVAKNLAAFGAQVTVMGVAGDDPAGSELKRAIGALDRSKATLVQEAGRLTTRKTRVVADHSHQVLRIDNETSSSISEESEDRLIASLKIDIEKADVLVLSDYLKGVLTPSLAKAAVELARKKGVPVAVNPKPTSVKNYAGASLISLNRSELAGATQMLPDTLEEALAASRSLRQELQADCVLGTMGALGLAADWEGGNATIAAPRVEVYDTAGAGDTVIASVALGLGSIGLSEDIFRLAAEASARVVRHVGVAVPTSQDLDELKGLN